MITIYHNPKCKKSRAGLEYLKGKGVSFELREYLKKPFSEDELANILMKMNQTPLYIVRTQEPYFKSDLKGKKFTDNEWLKILIENPKLIQRPIVTAKHKAVLAQPPELIEELL